jgi:hypothetical protein
MYLPMYIRGGLGFILPFNCDLLCFVIGAKYRSSILEVAGLPEHPEPRLARLPLQPTISGWIYIY